MTAGKKGSSIREKSAPSNQWPWQNRDRGEGIVRKTDHVSYANDDVDCIRRTQKSEMILVRSKG